MKSKLITIIIIIFVFGFYLFKLSSCTSSSSIEDQKNIFSACQNISEAKFVEDTNYENFEANFVNVNKYVFDNYCNSCHFPGGDKPELSSYEVVLQYIDLNSPNNSKLLTVLESGEMPPSVDNGSIFDLRAYNFIKKWISRSAPNK